MRKISMLLMAVYVATPVFAEGFDRPIPQAQSATAEYWYALACVALIAAMIAVQRLIARR